MGLGNFLRGVFAQVNPFDNGRTYGSYNPQRKKPQPGDPGYSTPAPTAPGGSPGLSVQQPTNHFDTGISRVTLPGSPKTIVSPLQGNNSYAPLNNPAPGTVIKPTTPAPAAPAQPSQPHQPPAPGTHAVVAGTPGTFIKGGFIPDKQEKKPGFWGKVGHGFKTAGETAVGTVANVPEVGLAALRAGSGIVQGVTELPHVVTAAAATGTQKLASALPENRFTHALNTGVQAANTGVKKATNWVDTPLNAVNRGLDRAATGYERAVPQAAGGAKVYKYEQIPLNVLAALVTAGGSTAADVGEGGNVAENAGRFSRFLNKPLTSNPENVIARTGQAVTRPTAPVVQALNTPFSSTRNALTRFIGNNRNLANLENEVVDAGELGNAATAAESAAGQTTQIPVTQEGGNVPIPVRTPRPGDLIRENSGDARFPGEPPTVEQAAANRARNAFDSQAPGAPDQSVSGIVRVPSPKPFSINPDAAAAQQGDVVDQYAKFLKDMGEGNGTQLVPDGEGGYTRTSNNFRTAENKGKRMTLANWRDQAEAELKAGRGEPGHQQMFDEANNPDVQSLLARGDTTQDVPQGRPITVKQVTGIPVEDRTVVPTGQVEVPGEVRPTVATDPNAAKTAAAASVPVVNTPPSLPADVQRILDNPRQFNKRQVAAARNQRKMANAVAKANEGTASAVDRIESVSPAAQSGEGFTPTGEFARSQNGGNYQKASRAAEMQQAVQETANMSPGDVIRTARQNQGDTGGFNRRDIRNIAALFEQKRIPRGTPEWTEARQILKEDGTIWGQTGALRNYTMRRTASADELISRYESKIYRLADDPSKIDSSLFDQVDAVESKFTDARDAALKAYNDFTASPTSQNAKVYHAAQDAADAADKEAKMTEFKVAKQVLKGNKDVKQARELEKMAQQADMYQMDSVDASMLSGTGTFVRNFVNAAVGGSEEGLFGRPAAWLSRKLTGESVGGGVLGRGSISGVKKGAINVVDASKARAGNAGINPLEHVKNFATTGNQLGDTIIDAQTSRNVLSHYTHLLKEEGYTGRELRDRASVMARQDPGDVGRVYAQTSRVAAGLGSGITRNNKIETVVKNAISDGLSFGNPNRVTETTAKLITRMTLGFPTAIGRSLNEGLKRFTLGAPTFIKAIATKDPQARAILIKEGLKQAGSGGLVIPPLFYALGQSGAITGAYPADPEERARWQREGISENSIKIGDNYYQLPAYLGSWAVPGLFYASLGRNGGDWAAAAKDTAKIVPNILPTDQLSNVSDVINGRSDLGKFMAQTGASAVRALEPGGALLNQVAKSFDPTQNDTSHGTVLENFVGKVLTGIPGVSNAVSGDGKMLPNKVDDTGNVLHNPGALPLAAGAASTVQDKGVQETGQENNQTNDAIKGLSDLGAFSDPNLKAVIAGDKKIKQIYDKIVAGKEQASPDEIKKLREAMVKGVSTNGDDTAYLEKEQYDTNLAALNMKRQLMADDPTTKPSDLKKMDLSIKRGQIYKDNQVPYDLIDQYKSTSLSDWRAMGDDQSDSYDPETYQKLWAIDELMAKGGGSYNKNNQTKQKFSAKESKARGGRSGNSATGFSADFGKLGNLTGMPTVQQYDTVDKRSGAVPVINTELPNIVHKIGFSG